MKIISVRDNPEYAGRMIDYFSSRWNVSKDIYRDCITHSVTAEGPLPQWYLLEREGEIIGCAGLVTNDFISRMDLYPWLCALYIEEGYRGNSYGTILIDRAKDDAARAGFRNIYLSTDHTGYYEKYGWEYIGDGYHPWDEKSRIYRTVLKTKGPDERSIP